MFSFLRRFRRPPDAATRPPQALIASPPADEQALAVQRAEAAEWRYQPVVSILTPVYRIAVEILRAAVESVLAQTYTRWELCLVYDAAETDTVQTYLRSLTQDARIRCEQLPNNHGISGNSNVALALATGEYIGLLDHDDTLAPEALYEIVKLLQERPHLDVIYSDKDSFGIHTILKPQWSPELLWSTSYLTHFTVLRTSLVRGVEGFRPETDGAQDWDLFLRAITRSTSVQHVPRVLYHWRIIAGSTATGIQAKPYAAAAQLRALNDHLERLHLSAQAVYDQHLQIRIRWEQPERQSVSVLLIGAGESQAADLRRQTRYAAFEVISVSDPDPAALDAAIRGSTGQCLVLLDRSVRPPHEAWLQDLVPPLQLDAIGAVAPLLLDPYTHEIRQAGFVFTRSGELRLPFAGEPPGRYGPLGRNDWYRNWSALSGACLAMRREAYAEAGGIVAGALPRWHGRPDVDLCLRLQYQAGLRLLLNPASWCEQRRPAWCDHAAPPVPELFPDGDRFYHPVLDDTVAPAAPSSDLDLPSLLDQLRSVPEHSNNPAGARDIAWCLPSFARAADWRPLLSYADELRSTRRVRSWFLIAGTVPPAVCRHRMAELYPRLAADCSFTPIPVGTAVAANMEALPGLLRIPNASRHYLWTAEYPDAVSLDGLAALQRAGIELVQILQKISPDQLLDASKQQIR